MSLRRGVSDDGVTTLDLSSHEAGVPLGMLLAPSAGGGAGTPSGEDADGDGGPSPPPSSSNVTLVAGWERCAPAAGWPGGGGGGGGHLGPIQRSGLVRLGDRLVRVNGRDVTSWSFREVMDALRELVGSAAPGGGGGTGTGRSVSRLRSLAFARPGTEAWGRNVDPALLPGHDGGGRRDATLLGALLGALHGLGPRADGDARPVAHHRRDYVFVSFVGGWRIAGGDDGGADGEGRSRSDGSAAGRNHSDGSADPLEEQLRKRPGAGFRDSAGPDDGGGGPGDAPAGPAVTPSPPSRGYVQYEVQCHVLRRRPSPDHLQPHLPPETRSWSVWRRYSEFRALDGRLRDDFGWQIDAAGGGRGIPFPGGRPAESWWYRTRNGGGYLTAVMGDSGAAASEAGGEGDDGGGEEEEASWTNLYGLWRTPSNSSVQGPASPDGQRRAAPTGSPPATPATPGGPASPPPAGGGTTCPYPPRFIRRRRSELAAYWTRLMEVEDMFDFSDASSHRFGSAMADFLGAGTEAWGEGRVPGAGGPGPADGPRRVAGVPPIAEDEPMPMDPPCRGLGSPGGGRLHPDDDVSLLSDGTGNYSGGFGAGYRRGRAGGPGRLVVDVLPHGLPARAGGGSVSSSRSARGGPGAGTGAASVSSSSTRRRMGRGVRPARPAFQRQFDM